MMCGCHVGGPAGTHQTGAAESQGARDTQRHCSFLGLEENLGNVGQGPLFSPVGRKHPQGLWEGEGTGQQSSSHPQPPNIAQVGGPRAWPGHSLNWGSGSVPWQVLRAWLCSSPCPFCPGAARGDVELMWG